MIYSEKYTKKVNAYILKEVIKIKSNISPKTTYDQAFVILMDEWNMDISIVATDISVKCDIIRDEIVIETFNWDNVYNVDTTEFDWNFIYKTVLEHIIKKKLYKRPKISKRKLKDI